MITRRTESGLIVKIMRWSEYQDKKKAQYKKWKEQSDYRLWSNNEKHR